MHRCTIFFLLSQTDTKRSPTLLYKELHLSFINIPCFSPKQNVVLLQMLPRRKDLKVSRGRTSFKQSKNQYSGILLLLRTFPQFPIPILHYIVIFSEFSRMRKVVQCNCVYSTLSTEVCLQDCHQHTRKICQMGGLLPAYQRKITPQLCKILPGQALTL